MSRVWKPSVTVAAVVERDGRFLLVEERTEDGLRINQPAGHLEPGETLQQAVMREALEETAHPFTPTALLGIYLWRRPGPADATTYLRFAFTGELQERIAGRPLDHMIVQTVWLSRQELAQRSSEWRSPLVARCIDDYLRGQRYPLDVLYAHPAAFAPATGYA
jgi:8-oxo-dGTP pyrophosphatase MutT (NUDIX family)